MKHTRFWLRVVCFLVVLGVCLGLYYRFITPEYYTDTWPTTSTYEGFYKLERDTADVLFFGSSHGSSGFMPQVLYNNYGITSYNLSCEEQNLVTTYYWLKEALKYQSPKAVVLDCYMCFPYFYDDEVLNSSETATRKAFDTMKWSKNKIEAIDTICELDETQDKLSYYLLNIRYHDRWEDIGINDYIHDDMMDYAKLMGSYALNSNTVINSDTEGFQGYQITDSTDISEMMPLMEEYLIKIVDVCKESGIELLLTMNPTLNKSAEQSKYLEEFSEENGVYCIDFNNEDVFRKIGYVLIDDNADVEHQNIWGAEKLTNYIGSVLANEFSIAAHTDEQWEDTKAYYQQKYNECNLTKIDNIDEYLSAVNSSNLTVIISVRDDAVTSLRDETKERLQELGVTVDLTDQLRCSFAAVIDRQEVVFESVGYEPIEADIYIQNGLKELYVYSAGYDCGCGSSISIDGQEYSLNSRGLNIVVYSNETRQVIDSVCFDTYDADNTMMR